MKYGTVQIRTDRILELIKTTEGIGSKNKLMQIAQLERTQLNKLVKGETQRIDLPVIARICSALNCKIEDIFVFVPAAK